MPRTTRIGAPRPALEMHLVLRSAPIEDLAPTPECDLEEADDDADSVVLRSIKTGRVIECYLHSLAKIENDASSYIVAVPCDPC